MPRDEITAPTWVVVSAFRYAIGRSSYIVSDTIDLIREHADALKDRGWHELVAEEIHQRVQFDTDLYMREEWERLADEIAPHMRAEAERARREVGRGC